MDRAAFEAYRARQLRAWRVLWWVLLAAIVGVGLAVGYLWTFAVGIPLTVVLALLAVPFTRRLSRYLWTRRFPEIAGQEWRWQRNRTGSG